MKNLVIVCALLMTACNPKCRSIIDNEKRIERFDSCMGKINGHKYIDWKETIRSCDYVAIQQSTIDDYKCDWIGELK